MQLFSFWQRFLYTCHHRIVTLLVSGKFWTINNAIAGEQNGKATRCNKFGVQSPWGHGIRQTWAARMWLCSGFHQERRWSTLRVWDPQTTAPIHPNTLTKRWNVETRLCTEILVIHFITQLANPCQVLCPLKWNPGPRAKRQLETLARAGTEKKKITNLHTYLHHEFVAISIGNMVSTQDL